MEIRLKKLPQSEVELEIEITAQDFTKFFEKAVFNLGESVKVQGFRKGKAPQDIILRQVGQEAVLMEAAKLAVDDTYKKALTQKRLEPISQPRVDILKVALQNPFCYKARFSVLPDIELPDYKLIAAKIKKEKTSVKAPEIEDALSWVQKSRPIFKDISRPAKKGDFVNIEFSSPQINNGKLQKDAFVLGQAKLLKGFEEQVQGMEKNGQKSFSILVPKDYLQKDIAGKKIDFQVKLEKIQEVELPEINDEFAKSLGNFKNLEDLRQNIEKGLAQEKEAIETQKTRTIILEEIEKKCEFEIPGILIDTEKQRMLNISKQKALNDFNISFQEYLKKIGKTEKQVLDSLDLPAKNQVKRFLIIRKIAEQEKINVTEQEAEQEVNEILKKYPDIKITGQRVDLDKLRDYTKERIRTEKALVRLESFTAD